MLRGLYTAYTGMLNEQYRMDIMSNNLANADTTGFKKEGSTSQAYADVMAVKIKDVSENPNTPKRLGNMSLGVKIGETFTDFSQGSQIRSDLYKIYKRWRIYCDKGWLSGDKGWRLCPWREWKNPAINNRRQHSV